MEVWSSQSFIIVVFTFFFQRLNAHNRVRNLGNLADLSQLEQEQQEQHMPPDGSGNQGNNYQNEAPTTPLHRSHTITERPQSMYTSQQQMNGPTRVSMRASMRTTTLFITDF